MADQTYAPVPRPPQLSPLRGIQTTEPDQITDVPTSAADIQDKKQVTTELGGTGTTIVNGFLSSQDYNPDFTGANRIDIFDEMRKSDGTVRSAISAVKLPILSADWYIKEPSGDDELGEPAEFVNRQLMKNPEFSFTTFLRQALTMI